MARIRQLIGKPAVTTVLFILAIALLLGGTLGVAWAALNAESQYYTSQVETTSISVALLEDGAVVADGGSLMTEVLNNTEKILPGVNYALPLSVQNTGTIDEYVRVTVYRYWTNADGSKMTDTKWDPDMIYLNFTNSSSWVEDPQNPKVPAAHGERTVLYYQGLLPVGETSDPFLESVQIKNDVVYRAEQKQSTSGGVTTITTTYLYNGACCHVKVVVDAVQGHNGPNAVKSAWGVDPSLAGVS